MTASNTITSVRRIASLALFCACAALTACGSAGADAQAAAPMSTQAAMGPIYFGDVISVGEDTGSQQATLVAGNQH